jgi:hypothetical protein
MAPDFYWRRRPVPPSRSISKKIDRPPKTEHATLPVHHMHIRTSISVGDMAHKDARWFRPGGTYRRTKQSTRRRKEREHVEGTAGKGVAWDWDTMAHVAGSARGYRVAAFHARSSTSTYMGAAADGRARGRATPYALRRRKASPRPHRSYVPVSDETKLVDSYCTCPPALLPSHYFFCFGKRRIIVQNFNNCGLHLTSRQSFGAGMRIFIIQRFQTNDACGVISNDPMEHSIYAQMRSTTHAPRLGSNP